MNRLEKLMTFCGILMLTHLTTVTNAQAQTFSTTVPLATIVTNHCVPEPVTIQGELKITIHQHFDGATGSHFQEHFVSKGTGLGAVTLVPYNFSEETHNSLQIPGPPQTVVQHFTINHVLISKGSVPNFHLKVRVRMTLNASGVPTADNVEIDSNCPIV